jgi:peroxiredoxin
MPSLQLLRQQLGTDDFEILAVNLKEGEPRIRRFLENLPLSFEILRDTDGAVARSWKVRMYPSSFVVDADGRLRHFVVGATDWSAAAVQKPLRDLLQSRRGNAVRR